MIDIYTRGKTLAHFVMALRQLTLSFKRLPFLRSNLSKTVRYRTLRSTSASTKINGETDRLSDSSIKHNTSASARDLDEFGHPRIDLSFENGEEAFRSKRTYELVRSLVVFNLCSLNFLIDNQTTILKWSQKVFGKRLFRLFMKSTFYGHFVAGEDHESIKPLISKNRQFGVKSILDYSVEEDLSKAEAKEAEMKSCVPENEMVNVSESPKVTMPADPVGRFRAHEEFGDRREKVVSARTYFYEDEAQCDKNMQIIFSCIDAVTDSTEKSGFAAIKLTALGRPQFLLQMSEVLVSLRNFFDVFAGQDNEIFMRRFREKDFQNKLKNLGVPISRDESKKWFSLLDVTQDGEVDLLDWDNLLEVNMSLCKLFTVPNMKTGELQPLVTTLSHNEEEQMKNMLHRVNKVVKYAAQKGVRIMVDAEQTYFQPAISRFTMEMMRKFNKDRAVVFNTYQCYLKQAYNNMIVDMDLAKRENFYFGAKLVRGAYMEQERDRAQTLGYEDPINASFEETTNMYNRVLEEVMKQINIRERGKIAVMIASHNEDTVRFTVEKMKEYNIRPEDRLICFGQLLGMCDQISFPLGQAGYSVYKYVPFGPVEEVLPYLSRRALENRGLLKKVQKEKQLLWQELKRRVKTGQMFYNPQDHIPPNAGVKMSS